MSNDPSPWSDDEITVPSTVTARVLCRADDHSPLVVHTIALQGSSYRTQDHPYIAPVPPETLDAAFGSLTDMCGHLSALIRAYTTGRHIPTRQQAACIEALCAAFATHGGHRDGHSAEQDFAAWVLACNTLIRHNAPLDPWHWWAVTSPRNIPALLHHGLGTPEQAWAFLAHTGPYDLSPMSYLPAVLDAWATLGVRHPEQATPWLDRGVNGSNVRGLVSSGYLTIASLPGSFDAPLTDLDTAILDAAGAHPDDAKPFGLSPAAYTGLIRVVGNPIDAAKFLNAGIINTYAIANIVGPSPLHQSQTHRSPLVINDLPVLGTLTRL